MKFCKNIKILSNKALTDDIYDLRLEAPDITSEAKPGQFVNIYLNDEAHLLPRPISICEANGSELRVVYRVVGAGTQSLSEAKPGDTLDITGPVGNGYDTDMINTSFSQVLLFGGGVGIPPMLELAKRIKVKTDVFLGYRDVLFLDKDFPANVTVHISTEDGSAGTKGNVMDALKESGIKGDCICACGPGPMLRAIKQYAQENSIKAYFSLEEHMACGVGACLGCVCKTKDVDEHSQVKNARVCVDGPVFDVDILE